MAQIQTIPFEGKSKRKIHPFLNIDMTPMVDLGFLLITFFIFTTTMAEKRTTRLIMPKEGKPVEVGESKAFTVLLGKDNRIFVYGGKFEKAVQGHTVFQTSYDVYKGLGSMIRSKQKQLQTGRDGLMLLIKPLATASYQNVIDALDEALINNVQRYALVEATAEERAYVEKNQ